jgi:hypothetical protein
MKSLSFRLVAIGLAASAIAAPLNATTIVADSINEDRAFLLGTWGTNNVGWFYTPSSSYKLAGLATRFRFTDGRTVGAAIYSGSPAGESLPSSLSLLGSGSLIASTSFTNAIFGAPVSLTSGTQYFFAFSNLADLGTNVTDEPGATNLGLIRFDSGPPPGTFEGSSSIFRPSSQPIVRFLGVASAVPEPSTWLMLILGFFGAGGAIRYARPKQSVAVTRA